MKQGVCTLIGVVGGFIAAMCGGWDSGLKTLIFFMIVDFVTGLIVAGIFKNSAKTKTGALESNVCLIGLARKIMILILVAAAYHVDLILNTTYIRDAVIIAFITNELISLLENAGLMGIPLPEALKKAVDVLQTNEKSIVSDDGEYINEDDEEGE